MAESSAKAYAKLLASIAQIQEESVSGTRSGLNFAILKSRWRIGQRIQESFQEGEARAPYDNQLLSKLANDLRKRYGRGFGRRSLNDMRRLYQKYAAKELKGSLSWTHYRLLLDLADDRTRKNLGERAVRDNWTIFLLTKAIRKLNRGQDESELPTLARPGGTLLLRRIKRTPAGIRLDLGFEIYLKHPDVHRKGFEAGDLVLCEKRGEKWHLERSKQPESERYFYAARLDHVIDGDTLAVLVDLGMGTETRQKLRLQFLDAPELNEKKGRKARLQVIRKLRQSRVILIKSKRSDKYARYLAEILFLPRETDVDRIASKGRFLNAELLDEGLAEYAST